RSREPNIASYQELARIAPEHHELAGHQPQQPDMGLVKVIEHTQVDQTLIHLRADVPSGFGATTRPRAGRSSRIAVFLDDRQRTGEQLLVGLIGTATSTNSLVVPRRTPRPRPSASQSS